MSESTKVMLLGTGDCGGELGLAFRRLGAHVVAVEACADAAQLGGLLDEHAPQYVVATTAEIPVDVLIAAAERDGVEVFPTPRGAR